MRRVDGPTDVVNGETWPRAGRSIEGVDEGVADVTLGLHGSHREAQKPGLDAVVVEHPGDGFSEVETRASLSTTVTATGAASGASRSNADVAAVSSPSSTKAGGAVT